MPTVKRISLTYELQLLAQALEGVVQLNDKRLDGDLSASTSGAVTALLVLARQRVTLLSMAVRDVIDPKLVWCIENAAPPLMPSVPHDRDRTLVGWSQRKISKRGKKSWKQPLG